MILTGGTDPGGTLTAGAGGAGGKKGLGATGGQAGVPGNGGHGGYGADGTGVAGRAGAPGSAGLHGGVGKVGLQGAAGTTSDAALYAVNGGDVTQQTLSLVITTPPPSSFAAGIAFGLTVTVEDGQGAVDTAYDGPISVELTTKPSGATLGGTVSMMAHSGVATFSGLTLSQGGAYALVADSGGVNSTAIGVNVTGSKSTSPSPTPTPTQVAATPALVKSKKSVTGISVPFNQPLVAASADNAGLYHVFAPVKKKHKTVYSKPLKIKSVSYVASSNSVTIKLAKPAKGKFEVAIDGAIEALDGATTTVDSSWVV